MPETPSTSVAANYLDVFHKILDAIDLNAVERLVERVRLAREQPRSPPARKNDSLRWTIRVAGRSLQGHRRGWFRSLVLSAMRQDVTISATAECPVSARP